MPMNPSTLNLMSAQLLVGSATFHRPICIWNTLTNELKGYDTPAEVLNGAPFFDFNEWSPGIYQINNYSTGPFSVVLFERTYIIEPGSEWQFIAHDEIATHKGFPLSGTQTRLIASYWDVPLGGSIWDTAVPDGPSLWDAFIEQ